MGRSDLERLSREELIELVLRLQRPDKASRTLSKPPSTDRKERCEQSKPGGAKPGHEGHSRVMSEDPDAVVEHRPDPGVSENAVRTAPWLVPALSAATSFASPPASCTRCSMSDVREQADGIWRWVIDQLKIKPAEGQAR